MGETSVVDPDPNHYLDLKDPYHYLYGSGSFHHQTKKEEKP
jgi:hypothetical protein